MMGLVTVPENSLDTDMEVILNQFIRTLFMAALLWSNCILCSSAQVLPETPETPKAASTKWTTAGEPAGWKFNNEQQWLIDGIGRDITEMLFYSKFATRSAPAFTAKEINLQTKAIDQNSGTYDLQITDAIANLLLEHKLTLTDYIWSTKTYRTISVETNPGFATHPDCCFNGPTRLFGDNSKCRYARSI